MTKQRYVSNHLVHFVGRRAASEDARMETLCKILKQGKLVAWSPGRPEGECGGISYGLSPRGNLAKETLVRSSRVCFADIPMEDLSIHMGKYSKFGICFERSFLLRFGLTPVHYLAEYSPRQEDMGPYGSPPLLCNRSSAMSRNIHQILETIDNLKKLHPMDLENGKQRPATETVKLIHSLYNLLSHHITRAGSLIKTFDPTLPEDHDDNFYMEREWRSERGVTFRIEDVSRIIIPKCMAAELRLKVPEYRGELKFVD